MTTKRRSKTRTEHDTMGEVRVPANALYGAQTQRAVENFPVSGLREHPVFTHAYVQLKRAAAVVNGRMSDLPRKKSKAIVAACDEVLGAASAVKGRRDLRADPPEHYIAPEYLDQFVVDVFQAGAGTSFHMNVNEVLANLANRSLGGEVGVYSPIHPNDDVNMGQSTNDTFPTATRLAILLYMRELLPALDGLASSFERKGTEFAKVTKSGRTHLQDAVPVTLGQEFRAWGAAIRRSIRLLESAADELRELGIGGSATGTGLNTPVGYRWKIVEELSRRTGLELSSMDDLREAMQSQQGIAAFSGALRNLSLELTRITNDIRLLSSGPLTGLAEINLPPVQPGSSIMPGKVNPSIPECMNQVAFHVIGADAAVAFAVQAGQLELNVMMPLMIFEILFSMEILRNFVPVFTTKCIDGIEANEERAKGYYVASPSLATALNPIIGYEHAAALAKESAKTSEPIPQLLENRDIVTKSQLKEMFSPGFLTGQADRKPPAGASGKKSGKKKKKG